jgi:glycine/D-amino acid oxidase-like deaminating enzyme
VEKYLPGAEGVVGSAVGEVEDFFSGLGRRLQAEDCGALSVADCQQLEAQQREYATKLSAARKMVATAGGLAELNSKLLLPAGGAIDPADLARLDTSFLQLDLLDDTAYVQGLAAAAAAAGADATKYQTEVKHVGSLIRAKLGQMRGFYQVGAASWPAAPWPWRRD